MIFDIDVNGGLSIKEEYPDQTVLLFIEPPGDNLIEQKEAFQFCTSCGHKNNTEFQFCIKCGEKLIS